jgi:hypothetical protein
MEIVVSARPLGLKPVAVTTLHLPPVEFQVGFVKKLPAEYTGDRHIVTVGREPDGLYHWEERPGPEPNAQNPGAEGACSTSRMRS